MSEEQEFAESKAAAKELVALLAQFKGETLISLMRRCAMAESRIAELEADAGRWRALIEFDGEYADGEHPHRLAEMWEFKPIGYDSGKSNTYYLGTFRGSLTQIVDAAIAAHAKGST